MTDSRPAFDAIVVGAGPAGSAAALALARAGRSVVLLERGPFPGSKNVYGGVIYGRILDGILPRWWEEVPVQRWVVRRGTMILTDTQALTVDFRAQKWGEAPYNGMTAYRADFDRWLADKAVQAGARLVTSTVATGLLRDAAGRINGVTTDRSDGDLRAQVVIACDGVNSLLARQAGILPQPDATHHVLGVKEVLRLPREVIDERFGLRGDEGLDIEILGGTGGIAGGGFLHTNVDTVTLGVVLSLPELATARRRPESIIADLKAHPAIAPYLRGATVEEYSAHLIPEGGYDAIPSLHHDGFLLAGDAAGMTLAAGSGRRVNFAIGAGLAARKGDAGDRRGRYQCAQARLVREDLERPRARGSQASAPRSRLVLSHRLRRLYPS
jgi:electron transfer flavoprotein-quinone oxidoreductase